MGPNHRFDVIKYKWVKEEVMSRDVPVPLMRIPY